MLWYEQNDSFRYQYYKCKLQVAYLIVDKMHHEHPKLMKDQYWTKGAPNQLPHTLASEQFKREYPVLSTNGITVEGINAEIVDTPNVNNLCIFCLKFY